MNYIDILGYTGASMGTIRIFYDLYSTIAMSNDGEGRPTLHYSVITGQLVGNALFLVYGVVINNEPIYTSCSAMVACGISLLGLGIFRYVKKERSNRLF